MRSWSTPFAIGALASALSLTGLGAGASAAQQEAEGFPVHIHTGTCDQLDPAPLHPLDNVHRGVIAKVHEDLDAVADAVRREGDRARELAGRPFEEIKRADEALRREHPNVVPVHVSNTTVDVPLADLLASPHAINAHASADEIDTYIACGTITGLPNHGELGVSMAPLSDSGYSGIAWLHEDGNRTQVTVFLTAGLPGADGTPAAGATPAA